MLPPTSSGELGALSMDVVVVGRLGIRLPQPPRWPPGGEVS